MHLRFARQYLIGLLLAWLAAASCFGGVPVLDTAGFWRVHYTLKPPVVRVGQDLRKLDTICDTSFPPEDWMKPAFDDSTWPRLPGAPSWGAHGRWGAITTMHRSYANRHFSPGCLALICMRGKFQVTDPAAVKKLTLSVRYRGGAVVYLNGTEIARGNLPENARIAPDTPAEDYPKKLHLRADGSLLGAFPPYSKADRKAGNVARWQSRIRDLTNVEIPAKLLEKGTNVLAVEIHRAPYHEVLLETARRNKAFAHSQWVWGSCGLATVQLTADGTEGIVPNVRRPQGFRVWNGNILIPDFDRDFGDPNEPLRPIRIVGTRGGVFSGKVLLDAHTAVKGSNARMSVLKHTGRKGNIPASRVHVRYALHPNWTTDTADRHAVSGRHFDVLVDAPPAVVPVRTVKRKRVSKGQSKFVPFGAVQPIWVTVEVPRDAVPGEYTGTLTVAAAGVAPVRVPVHLSVGAFRLPPPSAFHTVVDFMQSPESVALQYEVPIYGERHFKLLEESLKRLGEVGNWTVYLPLICHTNQGNEQAMVRWIKNPDGSYRHDFSVMERYLDLAEKHMGRPRMVCLYVWDRFLNSNYRKNKPGGPVPVSALDPVTGKVSLIELPAYGTPENRAHWEPFVKELRRRLKRRGLDRAVMLGLVQDVKPTREIIALCNELFPGVPWMRHAHGAVKNIRGAPVGYQCLVYTPAFAKGLEVEPGYGWRTSNNIAQFCRTRREYPLSLSRLLGEMCIQGEMRGFGRVGLDFWPVLKDRRGRRVGPIHGRYPESSWANLDKVKAVAFVPPGPDGAPVTTKLLVMREGLQECEARIFIERALVDPDASGLRAKLGEKLRARCRRLLGERTRATLIALENHRNCGFASRSTSWSGWRRWFNQSGHNTGYLWYVGSDWQKRSAELYAAAAEVAKKLNEQKRAKSLSKKTVSLRKRK